MSQALNPCDRCPQKQLLSQTATMVSGGIATTEYWLDHNRQQRDDLHKAITRTEGTVSAADRAYIDQKQAFAESELAAADEVLTTARDILHGTEQQAGAVDCTNESIGCSKLDVVVRAIVEVSPIIARYTESRTEPL